MNFIYVTSLLVIDTIIILYILPILIPLHNFVSHCVQMIFYSSLSHCLISARSKNIVIITLHQKSSKNNSPFIVRPPTVTSMCSRLKATSWDISSPLSELLVTLTDTWGDIICPSKPWKRETGYFSSSKALSEEQRDTVRRGELVSKAANPPPLSAYGGHTLEPTWRGEPI